MTKLSQHIKAGFSENQYYTCLVEANYTHGTQPEIQCFWKAKPEIFSLQNNGYTQFVQPLPHHIIWRKVLFFPLHLTQNEIYHQVLQRIKQELPIPLIELQFDYQIQTLEDRLRVALFVIRKTYLQTYAISPSTILDCELHCIVRALHFLHSIPLEDCQKYSYPIENNYFYFSKDGVVIQQNPINKNYILHCPPYQEQMIFDETLYLKTLGAALWNGMGLI